MRAAEIWVDFGEVDDRGYVKTPAECSTLSDLFPGRIVVIGDGTGHTSKAMIVHVDNDIINLAVIKGTEESLHDFASS